MRRALALFVACACFAQQPAPKKAGNQTIPKKDEKQTDEKRTVKSFLIWLAQVSGLSATSSGLKGDESEHQGDVWSEPIAGGARQRLTFEGGYSWTVFSPDDQNVFALRGGDLWSVPLNGGNPLKLARTLAGITSLLGSGPEGIVILTAAQIGTFSPGSGAFSPFPPASKEDRDTVDRLRLPIRSYDNGQLTVSETGGVILIDNGGKKREIALEKAMVWQPSVSHDRKRLVYIRSEDSPQ